MSAQVGDDALRIRVERLTRGEFKVEDLTTLFLALRERAGGREAVVEVGDFVAHRNERYKGIVNRAVRAFFLKIRFAVEAKERPLLMYDLPPYMPEFLQVQAERMNYKALKGATQFTRVNVKKGLPSLLSNVRSANGRCFLWPSISADDMALLDFLTGTVQFQPLFTEDSLFDEFCGALVENGLLTKKDAPQLQPLKGTVALFALSHMHQCFVVLGDGVNGYLEASPHGGGSDRIAVTAIVPGIGSKKVNFAHAVFLTDRTVTADCAPGMPTDPKRPWWNFPVEVGSDKKLKPLAS